MRYVRLTTLLVRVLKHLAVGWPQDEAFETPMQPITMMRNALGKEEGGSGVPLDRKKYLESVAYWKDRAPVV